MGGTDSFSRPTASGHSDSAGNTEQPRPEQSIPRADLREKIPVYSGRDFIVPSATPINREALGMLSADRPTGFYYYRRPEPLKRDR